ncbi:MAG: transcription initiation factor IIB family protein [Halobacteriales archaeon]
MADTTAVFCDAPRGVRGDHRTDASLISMGFKHSAEHDSGVSSRQTAAVDSCPDCDGDLVTVENETCCGTCGLVVAENRLDRGPEWRSFDDSEGDRRRTGAPRTPTRHDRGLSTVIGHDNVESGRKRRRLARMRRQHKRSQFASKAERNLATGFGEIARLTGALGLPRPTQELACRIFRQAQDQDLLLGRSIETMAAASVHAACRCGRVTRSIDELIEVGRVDLGKLELGYRVLNRELGLPAAPARPGERVPKLAADVDAPDAVRRRALELARLAEEKGVGIGCDPWGVAAGCLYLAGEEHRAAITQDELAEAAGVSRKPVRERYYELRDQLN